MNWWSGACSPPDPDGGPGPDARDEQAEAPVKRGAGQAVGNNPCCHPIDALVTGDGTGVESKTGAVHEACPVWAPNQVPPVGDHHMIQQVALLDRAANAAPVPSVVVATLIVPGPVDAPEVKVSAGSAACSADASGAAWPPAAARRTEVNAVDRFC